MSFRQALAVREFRWLLLAAIQSAVGDQLARVAISVLVFDRTRSTVLTALTFAMSFLPALVGGVLLSRLADIFPRRHVLVSCDAIRAVVVALLIVPGIPVVLMWVLLALEAMASTLFSTAQASMLPDVLEGPAYSSGSALWSATNQLSQLAGFALGGVVVAWLGSKPSISIDSASFVISAGIISWAVKLHRLVRTEHESSSAQSNRFRSMVLGARLLADSPRLRALASLVWLECFYVAGEGLAVPYAHSVGGGGAAVGLLLAVGPLGTAIGALLVTRAIPYANRPQWAAPLAVATAIPLMACGLRPGLLVTLAAWTISGMFSGYYVIAMAEFTLATPPRLRAQVLGIAAAVLTTAQGIAISVAGVVATFVGPARAVAIMATAGFICALVVATRYRRIDASTDTLRDMRSSPVV